MAQPKKKTPRKTYDWEIIEREYRAGQLSRAEIARKHGPSRAAIEKHVKKRGIVYGDLADRVRKEIQTQLVTDEVAGCNTEEAVATAVSRGKDVIKSHRRDIQKLQALEQALVAELQDGPTKLYIAQYQGQIIEKEISLTVAERAMAANNLANVQHKRIALERQAFNLDDKDGSDLPRVKVKDFTGRDAT